MRTIVVTMLGLIGGFMAGILLSAIIGIIGLLLFDGLYGIRFLPVFLAIVGAIVALLMDRRASQRPESPAHR